MEDNTPPTNQILPGQPSPPSQTNPVQFPPPQPDTKRINKIAVFLIVLAVLVISLSAFILYSHFSKTKNQKNEKTTKEISTQQAPATLNMTVCDTQTRTCIGYPNTWKVKDRPGKNGIAIYNSDYTAEVDEFSNPSPCSMNLDTTVQFHTVSVSDFRDPSYNLKVVGGTIDTTLGGTPLYIPGYYLVDLSYISKYSPVVGTTKAFASSSCYDATSPLGEVEVLTASEISPQSAYSWFNTVAAKTALEIFNSAYLNR